MKRLLAFSALTLLLSGDGQAQVTTQLRARGELTAFLPDTAPAWLIRDREPFLAPRLSVFGEVFAGERIYAFGELRADRGEAPRAGSMQLRIEQLLLRAAPFSALDFSVQAGKFISPFGNYPGRSHSSSDPLIRPPLNYDYRTTISRTVVAKAAAGFLNWKNADQAFRPLGAPIVWAVPYQLGAMAFGSFGKAAYRVALMNSAPSSEPHTWDTWFANGAGASVVAHLAYQFRPELRVGASFNRGAYLEAALQDSLRDAGTEDSNQQIIGAELTATRGLVELRAEVLFDRWDVPNIADDPAEISYFAELKWKLMPGLAAAARYGRIDFNEIGDGTGRTVEWDYDISRWQVGAMYNVTQKIEIRAEYMLNRGGTRDPSDNLFSLQAAWSFQRE